MYSLFGSQGVSRVSAHMLHVLNGYSSDFPVVTNLASTFLPVVSCFHRLSVGRITCPPWFSSLHSHTPDQRRRWPVLEPCSGGLAQEFIHRLALRRTRSNHCPN